jgi:hypothetical protein
VCDKIVSTYAQHTHAMISKITQKYEIKMQILTKNNQKFEKLSRNPSYRTKVKILGKTFYDSSPNKFGSAYAQSPRKCWNIEILAKIEGKESNFFSKKFTNFI